MKDKWDNIKTVSSVSLSHICQDEDENGKLFFGSNRTLTKAVTDINLKFTKKRQVNFEISSYFCGLLGILIRGVVDGALSSQRPHSAVLPNVVKVAV